MIGLGRGSPSLLGFERRVNRIYESYRDFGPNYPKIGVAKEGLITYSRDGHLLTVAPTGAGKGVSSVIPTLLSYPGPVVVLDPKGENYAVTSRYRERDLKQTIIKLDPFGVQPCLKAGHSGGFNPLDIFAFSAGNVGNGRNYDLDSDAQMLASMLASQNTGTKEPFWDNNARALLSALIAYIGTYVPASQRTLSSVLSFLKDPGIQEKLSEISEDEEVTSRLVKEEFAFFGMMDEKAGWPGLLSTCSSYLSQFMSNSVINVLEKTSFAFKQIYLGAPITIYLVIPPEKLKSHSALLRLWIGTLLYILTSRSHKVYQTRTLFILDECAQLGTFPLLEQAITICRSYGLQIWTFWQDLSQLAALHGASWPTIVNNCSVQQFFGCTNYGVAADLASMIGCHSQVLREIGPDNEIVVAGDGIPRIAKRLNYLADPEFDGRHMPNPYYEGR